MRGEDCVDKVKILTVVVHGDGRQIDKNTDLGSSESEIFAFKTFDGLMLQQILFWTHLLSKLKPYEPIC